jgi:hypothetical protein
MNEIENNFMLTLISILEQDKITKGVYGVTAIKIAAPVVSLSGFMSIVVFMKYRGINITMAIIPQCRVVCNGKVYFLDFGICYDIGDGQWHSAGVEIDGHEWHEKTKEQAGKDKKRERDLLSEGYKVIRFTGSEIFHDPYKCIGDIFNIITSDVGKKNV